MTSPQVRWPFQATTQILIHGENKQLRLVQLGSSVVVLARTQQASLQCGACAAGRCIAITIKQVVSPTMSGTRAFSGLATFGMGVVMLLLLPSVSQGCFIQGHDSGECLEPEEFRADMEFCGNVVAYRACVPKENPLWPKHDVFHKDKWVAEMYSHIVSERVRHETNETLQDAGVNELGEEGEVEIRFFENPDCQNAFKNYFCWLNFPRCDSEDASLILCRSACENLMDACEVRGCARLAFACPNGVALRATLALGVCVVVVVTALQLFQLIAARLTLVCVCVVCVCCLVVMFQYADDLRRCGKPEFFGGEEPEIDDILDDEGNPIYWRGPWPGQPFRDNEFFGDDDDPVVVCTPSIKNAAPSSRTVTWMALCALSLLTTALVVLGL